MRAYRTYNFSALHESLENRLSLSSIAYGVAPPSAIVASVPVSLNRLKDDVPPPDPEPDPGPFPGVYSQTGLLPNPVSAKRN
jgi:hypothetical protein